MLLLINMSKAAHIFLSVMIVGFVVVAAAPFVYATSSCDLSPGIPLEVGIGSSKQSTGLTNYVSQVYQFIVSSIGIIAAVMIMFNGFRWVTAGGNAEAITVAKGGVTNAIIGLLIALMSYVLLYTVNAQLVNLVDICPKSLDFSNSTATTTWTTCPSENASECASVSYCAYDGGCECVNVGTGDGKVFACRPVGTDVIPSGVACQNTDNCQGDLDCIGNSTTTAGTCTESTSGETCKEDKDCTGGATCIDTGYGFKRCFEATGRENGEFCEEDTECASGVCNTSAGVDQCSTGDGTDGVICYNDSDCATAYKCSNYKCAPKAEKDDCDKNNAECGVGLYCVEADDRPGDSTCTDGSEGDDCDGNNECDSGFCGENQCTTGAAGAKCDQVSTSSDDCVSRICVQDWTTEEICQ